MYDQCIPYHIYCIGILVVKRNLFKNPVPSVCGGGTVFFVSWLNVYKLTHLKFPTWTSIDFYKMASIISP